MKSKISNSVNKEKKKKIIINLISKIINKKTKDIKLTHGIGNVNNWDSLTHIKIYLILKKKFKYNGELNNLSNVRTVNDWIEFFSKK